jgi:hypothetical protein
VAPSSGTEGSKSTSLVARSSRGRCANIYIIRGFMTHIVRKFCACARFTPDARHIREFDANNITF